MSSTIPLYNALIKAGAPEEDARSAAESVAQTDQMATKADLAEVKGELTLIRWMLGVVLVFLIAISARLFFLP